MFDLLIIVIVAVVFYRFFNRNSDKPTFVVEVRHKQEK